MWFFDDINRRNPPGKGQRSSILPRLLQTCSTTEEFLCETSDDLECRGQPFVCCLGQLPYPLSLEPVTYAIRGGSANISLHVDFRLFAINVNGAGQLDFAYITPEQARDSEETRPIGTQVRAFVPVWGRRMVYYDAYWDCLHDDGLEERIISTTAWHPSNAPAAYTGEGVTAHAFEAELASRVASELRYVLRKFLAAYSVVALEELLPLNRLYGCFLLTAPGRVTYAAPPEPVLSGLLNRLPFPTVVKTARIEQALKFGIREIDGYLSQILAMHRLAKQGEPKLAIVGCVTAIEWFMNSFVQQDEKWSLSIKECLKKVPFTSLPDDLKRQLRTIAETRNAIVHGEPPSQRGETRASVEQDFLSRIAQVVQTGVDLYREINLRRL